MTITHEWLTEKSDLLINKSINYTSREKESIRLHYLISLFTKLKTVEINDQIALQEKIELVISSFPEKTEGVKIKYNHYLKHFGELKSYIQKRFNLFPKDHYRNTFLPLGMCLGMPLGLPFGVALDNIALGLPLGIPIGLAIGAFIGSKLDKKVTQENRTI